MRMASTPHRLRGAIPVAAPVSPRGQSHPPGRSSRIGTGCRLGAEGPSPGAGSASDPGRESAGDGINVSRGSPGSGTSGVEGGMSSTGSGRVGSSMTSGVKSFGNMAILRERDETGFGPGSPYHAP